MEFGLSQEQRMLRESIDRVRRFADDADDSGENDDACLATIDIGRVMVAADTLGAAQNMLDQSVAYAMQREQFDRVIASFQAVKHLCAEMAAEIEPSRALVCYAAYAIDEPPSEARLTACHAKAHLAVAIHSLCAHIKTTGMQ